jgi:hypothetical protein
MSMTRSGSPLPVPGRSVRAELPERVVVFLRAVGTRAPIRALMAEGGYTRADHVEGWELLGAVCAFGEGSFDLFADAPARAATAAIERWVATHFSRFQAALEREVGDGRLFDGIERPAEREAVLALATLLARLDDLPARSKVVAVLARRGLDKSERQRLAEQVGAAQSAPAPTHDGPAHEERIDELTALYRWYSDWAATARAVIARRDYLIAMGLAERVRRRGARGAAVP